MRTEAPPTRRKFADTWDEIDYLYHKTLYWLYERARPAKALRFARRLEQLLESAPGAEGAIQSEECRSLICEAKGDLGGAVRHRENEIRLIRRLHKLSRDSSSWDYVKQRYGDEELSDRLDLLATLYHDRGDLGRAIRALEDSKQLCEAHGLAFDGQDLLEEYLAEKSGGSTDGSGKGRRQPVG
jgi:hypothetical protein